MADVTLKLAEEHASKPKSEQSRVLDDEVERFSQYMSSLGDWKARGHLISQERALIKTYLIFKLKEEP